MQKIYVVTGASGFVGSVVVKSLVEQGSTVHAFVRNPEKAKAVLGDAPVRLFCGDIRDAESLAKAFDIPNAEYVLIHSAAIISIGGGKKLHREMRDVNINGTRAAIDCALKFGAKLVHVSSVHAIPELKKRALMSEVDTFDPKLVKGGYARTKTESSALVNAAVKEKGLNAVMVHPSGIIGPDDYSGGLLTQMVSDYIAGKIPAAVKGGYDFVDVRDVAFAIITAAQTAASGSKYILSNRFCSVREILDTLSELTGRKKIGLTLPICLAYLGLPFISFFSFITRRRPLYTAYSLYTLGSNSNFNHAKATEELNFEPRPIKESLADTLNFVETKLKK